MPPVKVRLCALAVALAVSPLTAQSAPARAIKIGGTGGVIEVMRQLGVIYSAETGRGIVIVPALGSRGGIRALADKVIDVAFAGRALISDGSKNLIVVVLRVRIPLIDD